MNTEFGDFMTDDSQLDEGSRKPQRHILVTGALGHIGSALIREPALVRNANRLTLVDDLSTQRYCSLFGLPAGVGYEFLEGDVASIVSERLLADVDAVVHLAATVDPVNSAEEPQALRSNNLRITSHVAQTCRGSNTPMVYVSSTSVYSPSGSVVDESSSELSPTGAYAQCKLEEEALVSSALDGGEYAIFRLGTIFGPSPGMRFQTAVNKFCWQTATGVPVNVWTTALQQVRPYLALSDCTALLARAVVEGIYPRRAVNAVTCNVTVADVLDCIREAGFEPDIRLVDSPIMNSLSFSASTDLANSLGFAFQGNLRHGVEATLRLIAGISRAAHW
jgi:nucleoside-diphosphate-sugar epimerase